MKNKLVKGVISASVSLLSFGATASNLSDYCDLVPYVGADAQWRTSMEFKKGYGKEQTKSSYPQGNIYLGLKLNQYVGLEAGYEQTTTIKKSSSAPLSDMTLGVRFIDLFPFEDPNNITQFNTRSKINAFHASVVGFLPLSEAYCLQLIGSLGIARTNVRLTVDIPELEVNRVFSKKKWVPKVGVGLQHMINCQLGVRAMLGWEGTGIGSSSVQNIAPLNAPDSEFRARTDHSLSLGLGLFYNFK